MSLYKRHRPEKFEDVEGNEKIIRSISAMLDRDDDKIPQAICIHGLTGCGKTTLARIVAYELGAHDVGIVERNMADESKRDDAREIGSEAERRPLKGKWKVFILDEAHELSTGAKSTMLKILEEAPKHVVFILCTNKINKLPKELRDRCQTFEVMPLTNDQMLNVLDRVVELEEAKVPDKVLEAIVDRAQGCARKAIQDLEQVIDLKPEEMEAHLGNPDQTSSEAIDLCRVLANKSSRWAEVRDILVTLEAQPENLRLAVLGYCNAIVMKQSKLDPAYVAIMESFKEPFFHDGKFQLTLACARVMK